MGTSKMLILRGNADTEGKLYPDENGKTIPWPNGALHVRAAEDYAKTRGYLPETLLVQGHPQNDHSSQAQEVLKRFVGLKYTKNSYVRDSSLTPDQDIRAFYGFSGGGYNLYWILQYLAAHTPDDLQRIDLVVVIGVEKEKRRKGDYDWPAYNGIAKRKVHPRKWEEKRWETVYHTNPDTSLLPKGLPAHTSAHMFGPDVLLAGHWPEET
jgi:hypothetical protein